MNARLRVPHTLLPEFALFALTDPALGVEVMTRQFRSTVTQCTSFLLLIRHVEIVYLDSL